MATREEFDNHFGFTPGEQMTDWEAPEIPCNEEVQEDLFGHCINNCDPVQEENLKGFDVNARHQLSIIAKYCGSTCAVNCMCGKQTCNEQGCVLDQNGETLTVMDGQYCVHKDGGYCTPDGTKVDLGSVF